MARDYSNVGKRLRKDITPITNYKDYVPSERRLRFSGFLGELKSPIQLYPAPPITPISTITPEEVKQKKEEFLRRKGLKNTMKERGLAEKLGIAVGCGSIFVSLLHFSTNVTGFAIQSLNQTDTNIVGAIFFVFGVLILLTELKR